MDVLSIRNLNKSFGDKAVLKGLELRVPEHSIYGFVGRNGAGKTTAMKAVLGLLRTDGGEISVCGERVCFGQTPTNRYIGYLPDVPSFYKFLTPREYLRLCGECLEMEKRIIEQRSEELLSLVGLYGENHRIKGFSRGMKQRLGIAAALLSQPKLLLCDEPTSALDPIGRKEILDVLLSVRQRTTVLFSTHILSDVERICTDVAFLNDGKIVLRGSVEELKRSHCYEGFEIELLSKDGLDSLIGGFGAPMSVDGLKAVFRGDGERMREVLTYIAENGISIRRIERTEQSLEALFVEVISK